MFAQTETSGMVYSPIRFHCESSFAACESVSDHSAHQKRGEKKLCCAFITEICIEICDVVMPSVEKLISQA